MRLAPPAWTKRILIASCALSACADAETPRADPQVVAAPPVEQQALPLDALVTDHSRPALCERPAADVVRDAFCSDAAPSITGLADLQRALKLKLVPDEEDLDPPPPVPGMFVEPPMYAVAVMLTHSTALSAELVSPINPRAIVMTYSNFLAFNRGVQQVEIAARDRDAQRFNFYLLSFHQDCNAAPGGCTNGDLYTPSIESNWTQIALQDDEALKNTPSDCRQCHQRGSEQPTLLMRELDGPWTHFFAPESDPHSAFPEPLGEDLLRDFLAAKDEEPYAALPTMVARTTLGFLLQNLVNPDQPLIFDGASISNERWPWSPDGYVSEARRSPTWDAGYEAFKRGELMALPYYAPRATDPDKQAQLTAAYRSYREGTLPAQELPDLAEIFPDDPHTRAEIGLQTEPDATPAELLIQACGTCHNDVLDQTLSRARFNIAVGKLAPSELAVAIGRLELARKAPGAMPPPGRRQLDDAARTRLIDYLRQRMSASSEDDELLDRAAQLGMAQRQSRKPSSYPATIH